LGEKKIKEKREGKKRGKGRGEKFRDPPPIHMEFKFNHLTHEFSNPIQSIFISGNKPIEQ